jgi:hypothetical protein
LRIELLARRPGIRFAPPVISIGFEALTDFGRCSSELPSNFVTNRTRNGPIAPFQA